MLQWDIAECLYKAIKYTSYEMLLSYVYIYIYSTRVFDQVNWTKATSLSSNWWVTLVATH